VIYDGIRGAMMNEQNASDYGFLNDAESEQDDELQSFFATAEGFNIIYGCLWRHCAGGAASSSACCFVQWATRASNVN
jgi:hypothetical protein